MKKSICFILAIITVLVSCMICGYVASADSLEAKILVDDDFKNWDNVYNKSSGWQLDPGNSVAGTGKLITKNNNDKVQHVTYMVKEYIGSLEITAYEVFTTTDLPKKINVYLSNDGNVFEKKEVSFSNAQQLNGTSWYKLVGKIEIPDDNQYKYVKIELGILGTEACWYAGIGHVKILSYAEKNSSDNESDKKDELVFRDKIDDKLDDFNMIYQKSDGFQIDKTLKNLGSVINKKANNDTQFITYKIIDINDLSIEIAYLSSSPELIGFVNAYYSEDNNSNWQKIEFKKTETTSKQEGWSTATLVAKDLGVKGNLYLKVVIYPIAYYSGADAIENCYGIGISSINVNGATVDNNEEKEDNKTAISDKFDNFEKIFDRTDLWQLDKTNKELGNQLNKLSNNEVLFITYKLNGLKSFAIKANSFKVMSDVKKDIKVYVSSDNKNWKPVNLKYLYGKTIGDWTQKYLYAENIANDINYLKIEMQKLDIDAIANCFVTSLASVDISKNVKIDETVFNSDKTDIKPNEEKEDNKTAISDKFDNFEKIFDRTDLWQLDKTNKELGNQLNKLSNNEVLFITYKLNGLKSFAIKANSFKVMSDVKKDIKVYVSSDNKNWKPVNLKYLYGKTIGDWTQKYLYAENIANDINYLKIEMQKLDIDVIANCFVTSLASVDITKESVINKGLLITDIKNEAEKKNDMESKGHVIEHHAGGNSSGNNSGAKDINTKSEIINDSNIKYISTTLFALIMLITFDLIIAACVITAIITKKINSSSKR